MHKLEMEVGDLHADLWGELDIKGRWISGPHDITIGHHAALGLCVVSHFGLEDRIVWITERPVAT